jgi:hypothetical protein
MSRTRHTLDVCQPNFEPTFYSELLSLKLKVWYRYGDSNPGPVAENHVS